jgi:type II secretory pathway component PulF
MAEQLMRRHTLARDFFPISYRETAMMAEQMSALLGAGVPMERIFAILKRGCRREKMREAIETVEAHVAGGKTFYEGFAARAHLWPRYFVEMVRCAELAGQLQAGLGEAAEHFRQLGIVRRKAHMVWISPALIIMFGWVCIIAAYAWFQGPASGWYKLCSYAPRPLPFLILAAVWMYVPPAKQLLDSLLLSLPAVGGVFRDLALYQFTTCFRYLYIGAVSAPDMLHYASLAVTNTSISHSLAPASTRVEEGTRFAEALAPCLHWPNGYIEELHVAEISGNLETSLAKLAAQRREALDTRVNAIRQVVDRLVGYATMLTVAWTILHILLSVKNL